jgi:aromatic-L-amino-acid decarboxylase
MDPKRFRADLHRAADEVADYLEQVADLPVLPTARPGDLLRALPASPPEAPESFDQVLRDYREQIVPRLTHWNHPGFMAYFSSSGSEPGILGELLTAGTAVNAMLWQTSPAGTELEMRVCDWLRQMVGLPPELRGHITDTASTSTFLALAAARHEHVDGLRERGLIGRADLPPLVVYCGDQRHSSIDKAVMTLGLGLEQLRAIPADDNFALDPAALAAAIAEDRRAGRRPIAVVATVGSTSTTSVDPVAAIAEICAAEGLWLHVDAAWAGSGALCPELRHHFAGWERADSVVVNPHKWMFVPTDCSVLFVRGLERMRAAFALLPEYLRTADQESDDPDKPVQLMDLGFQLGRRFRSLKLWLVIRHYGVEGLRAILREHCRLGAELARWVDEEPGFERCAPTPFSTVCFRALLPGGDEAAHEAFNAQLLAAVNAQGPVYFGHTKLRGRYVLRVAISNLRTTEADVQLLWRLLREQASSLRAGF